MGVEADTDKSDNDNIERKSVDLKDLTCTKCYELPWTGVYQCKAGHLMCGQCHYKTKKCPECRVPIGFIGIRVRSIEKILGSVPYKCPNWKEGCDMTIEGQNLDTHLVKCGFQPLGFCRDVGIRGCWFRGTTGEQFFKHFETTHKIKVLTSQDNVVQFKDFTNYYLDLWEHIYLFKYTEGDKEQLFVIYRKLPPRSKPDGDMAIMCFHLGSTPKDLEEYQFIIQFTFNKGEKKTEVNTKCPIHHFKEAKKVVLDPCPPDSGLLFPIKDLITQANNPISAEVGENYVEINFQKKLICQSPATSTEVDVDTSPSPNV